MAPAKAKESAKKPAHKEDEDKKGEPIEDDEPDEDKKVDAKADEVKVSPDKKTEGFIDLNRVFDYTTKKRAGEWKGLGKLAEEWDTEGATAEQLRSKFADLLAPAKHLMVTRDLKSNALTVHDMRELCPPENERLYEDLDRRLNALAQKYAVPMDRLLQDFAQASGSIEELERRLKGESVPIWTEIEDLALSQPEDSPMMKYLISKKGEQAVAARKRFLGIVPSSSK